MVGKEIRTSSPSEDRKAPKVLDHLRVYQGADGGHIVERHFTHYEHQPEKQPFGEDEGPKAISYIAQHAHIDTKGLDLENESEPEHGKEPVAPKK